MIANGTLKTIDDQEDIYVSLTQLCEYFAKSSLDMKEQAEQVSPDTKRYAQGMVDLMFTISEELIKFGKFEAQKRMIEGPDDLLAIIDKANKKK